MNVDDEILAVNDERVLPAQWKARIQQFRAGDRISILVSRRERLRRIEVTLDAEPRDAWKLEPRPDASEVQQARRTAWLAGSGTSAAG